MRIQSLRVVSAALLATVLSLIAAVPAHAVDGAILPWATPTGDTRAYRIVNDNADPKGIAIKGAVKDDGVSAILHSYTKASPHNDQFRLEWQGKDNWFRLKPVHTWSDDDNPHNDKCLAVQGAAYNDEAHVNNYGCTYGDTTHNDVWLAEHVVIRIGNAIGDELQFRNLRSRKCLVVKGGAKTDGAQLIQYDCNHSANSFWTVSTATN